MTPQPERTPDGRFLLVGGRRWRASDPAIPDPLRAELVAALMDARRAVRAAGGGEPATAAARERVRDAKVALGERGERGEPWWEPASEAGRSARLRAAMLTLLRARDPARTICPSDAARVAGGAAWRAAMQPARDVAADLADAGVLEVRQRGRPVDIRGARGPVRLARGPAWPGVASPPGR
ncbi:MAG TPA: DUF3253 domain-containing protein [Miltoncostaeaceae bacterium]|nr:DUF3253 domain-containing protein [Miltoncostaeaceae bacterium]